MKICGQTLILIDNDGTVSEVNQKIIKATVKYMIYHAPEDRAFCISTYGHELEEVEEFTRDKNDLLCKVDLLEFAPKDSNLTDVLTQELTQWRNSDFACRDIVVFTDGLESTSINYEDEELFYLIENTSYPIYIVDLVQDNNEMARKHLSAIATTSEGSLFLSEFEGDDGGVDRQISDGIYAKMDEYARREWYTGEEDSPDQSQEKTGQDTTYEEVASEGAGSYEKNASENTSAYSGVAEDVGVDSTGLEGVGLDGAAVSSLEDNREEILSEEYFGDNSSYDGSVYYESIQEVPFYEKPGVVIGIVLAFLAVIILGLVAGMLFVKRRRNNKAEDREIEELARENTIKEDFFGREDDEKDIFDQDFFGDNKGIYNEDDDRETRLLMPMLEDDNATRLLSETKHQIILTDSNDSRSKHEISFNEKVVIGRSATLSDYLMEDDSVSKKHCEISFVEGHYYIKDLDSSNGTIVNGNKITSVMIKNNDWILLGEKRYIVRVV